MNKITNYAKIIFLQTCRKALSMLNLGIFVAMTGKFCSCGGEWTDISSKRK